MVAGFHILVFTLFVVGGGRYHIFGHFPVEDLPCQFGIVDKHIAVALDTVDHFVAAHFPSVHRVQLMPLQQHIDALEHIGDGAALAQLAAVADPNIQADTGHIALGVVQGLHVAAALFAAVGTACDYSAVYFPAALHIAVFIVAAGSVEGGIGGTDVVQVGTGAGGVKATQTLGPNMLTIPALGGMIDVALKIGDKAGIHQVDGHAVAVFAVGLHRQITALVIAGLVGVGSDHQCAQGLQQVVTVQAGEGIKGILAGVVGVHGGAIQRCAYFVTHAGVGLLGIIHRIGKRTAGQAQ